MIRLCHEQRCSLTTLVGARRQAAATSLDGRTACCPFRTMEYGSPLEVQGFQLVDDERVDLARFSDWRWHRGKQTHRFD